MRKLGEQIVTSIVITETITTPTYILDCEQSQLVNAHLTFDVDCTVTIINATGDTQIMYHEKMGAAGVVVSSDVSVELVSNNDAKLSGLGDRNTYYLMGDMTNGGAHQMATLGKLPA